MKKFLLAAFAASAITTAVGHAQLLTNTYAGNGNAGFGGAVGNGSLQIVNDNLGALNFTFTRGTSGIFNDALVLYFNTTAGGATNTSGFTDSADGLRRAISGVNTNGDRSTLNFASGFGADFAIAFDSNFAGLWSLSSPSSFGFISNANLTPTGTTSNSTYAFGINVTNIGLTPASGQSYSFFASYISTSAFRSTETIGSSFTGSPTQGYNTFDAAGSNTFTTVPEPSTYALLALSALGLAGYAAGRRALT